MTNELDWELMNFFNSIANDAAEPSRLRVALFDFEKRQCEIVKWDIDHKAPIVVLGH